MVVTLTRLPMAQQLAIRALLESGTSIRKVARTQGVSRETVIAVKNAQNLDPQAVTRIKDGLAGKLYHTADRSIDSITDDKLEKSTAVQAMTTAAIAIDKARLIEGKATSRSELVTKDDKELNEEIARLEGQLEMWKSGEVVNGEVDTTGYEDEQAIPATQSATSTVEGG